MKEVNFFFLLPGRMTDSSQHTYQIPGWARGWKSISFASVTLGVVRQVQSHSLPFPGAVVGGSPRHVLSDEA